MNEFAWDHYVEYSDPKLMLTFRERYSGRKTAEIMAEQKRHLGFVKVKIISRPFSRHKERLSHVVHGRLHGFYGRGADGH